MMILPRIHSVVFVSLKVKVNICFAAEAVKSFGDRVQRASS
jgi:hypothetical protein